MFLLESLTSSAPRAIGLPVLAGERGETLFGGAMPAGTCGQFELFRKGEWLIGRAEMKAGDALEEAARALYESTMRATAGLHLCRIWNYVPRINEAGKGGLENYRAFCRGRSVAFEAAFGGDFKRRLPAASAVGTEDGHLTVVFAACGHVPRHVENPDQVPAYEYPHVHGPRPPSFSRATVVPNGRLSDVFISGTAAIQGHQTVAPGNTQRQIAPTLRNLGTISLACGLGAELGRGRAAERHFKIYLRHADDLALVERELTGKLVFPGDRVSYLRADVCRAELNLEIEATIRDATVS